MMYEKQYSEDLEKLLSPLEAHHEWINGNLSDKSAFSCRNPKCTAKFTCVNMDKFSKERVNRIHFRLVGEHIPDCKMEMELVEKGNTQALDEEQKARDYQNGIDYLILDTTAVTKPPKKKESGDVEDEVDKKKKALSDANRNNTRNSKYHTILPMVINYLEYERAGMLDLFKVNNSGKEMTYKEFFYEFTGKKINELIKGNRIFHGNAKLKRVKGGYRLEFQTIFNFRGLERKPSAYISDNAIESGWKHKMRGEELIRLAESDMEFHAFIYGEFGINNINIENKIVYFPVVNFPYDKKNKGKRLETINLVDYKDV